MDPDSNPALVVARNLRRQMRETGFTPSQIAFETGISESKIARILDGWVDIRVSMLAQLGGMFGICPSLLLIPLEEDAEESPSNFFASMSPEEHEEFSRWAAEHEN